MSSNPRRIYVGRLSSYTQERDLRDKFEEFGRIASIDLKRGYGFIEYEDERDADDAIYEMDRRRFDGSTITVQFAKGTKRDRVPRGPPQRSEHRAKVFNLPIKMSWQDLKDHFRPVAEVIFAECFPGRKSATANIEFNTREDMKRAIAEFDGSDLQGEPIYVEEDTRRRPRHRRDSRDRSMSPARDRSLSPRRSRSPRKYSRSPDGRRSVSPRRLSRSPAARRSDSPRRRTSRSPDHRRSVSPRRLSRSPDARRSGSPRQRSSRSPDARKSPQENGGWRRESPASGSPDGNPLGKRSSRSASGSPEPKKQRTESTE